MNSQLHSHQKLVTNIKFRRSEKKQIQIDYVWNTIVTFGIQCNRVNSTFTYLRIQDAHILDLTFDVNSSLFAVMDGHGGSEVALYCSKKLPAFLKNLSAFKSGDYERALKDAFIGFDATLVCENVIQELKQLMPEKVDGDSETDCEEDEENITG